MSTRPNVKRLIGLLSVLFAAFMLNGCAPALRGEFMDAIEEGNLTRVKSILAEKPELVNAEVKDLFLLLSTGLTPLMDALMCDNDDVAKFLIAKGAHVNAKSSHGTPLHIAVVYSNKDMVELLIGKGADVNAKDDEGRTPLCEAAYGGNREEVKLLIANGADVNIGSPLLRALGPGRDEYEEVVKLLIEKGADVNVKRKRDGQTPLHRATVHGVEEIVKLLIAKGADVNAKNKYGRTPLHWEIDKEVVQLLIANGANVNAKDDDGMTPLHAAAQGGEKEVAEILIADGADVTAKIKGFKAKLRYKLSMPGSAPFKAKYKSRLRELWPPGSTPLHLAASQGHEEIVRLLIESGADVNAKDDEGRTPLLWMALYEMYKGGGTPLHVAALTGGNKEKAQLLIAEGADVNAKDDKGHTPLYYAEKLGHKDIAELLRKHGAVE